MKNQKTVVENYKEARMWLRFFREFPDDHLCYRFLMEELERCGLAPEDIGSSRQELEKLKRKGYILRACWNLEWLHEEPDNPLFFEWLLEEIKEGDISLDVINTNKRELLQLKVKHVIIWTQRWFKELDKIHFLKHLCHEITDLVSFFFWLWRLKPVKN